MDWVSFLENYRAETENLGANVELFSTEGGLRVDFIKLRVSLAKRPANQYVII